MPCYDSVANCKNGKTCRSPPHTASTPSCARALPHFASYIMEERKFSLPLPPSSIAPFYIFFFSPWRQRDCSFLAFDVDIISPGLLTTRTATPPLSHTSSSIHPHSTCSYTTHSFSVFDWTRPFYEFSIAHFFFLFSASSSFLSC